MSTQQNDLATTEEAIVVSDISMANRSEVVSASVKIMSALQGLPARTQLMAVAACFYLIIRSTNLRPLDLLDYVNNMAYDRKRSDLMVPQFAALKWHIRNWLLGKGER